MSAPRIISFRIEADKVDELDQIAKTLQRDRSYLLNEAVEDYLREQRKFAAMVEEGREDMRNGRYSTDEEVERMVDVWSREAQSKAG